MLHTGAATRENTVDESCVSTDTFVSYLTRPPVVPEIEAGAHNVVDKSGFKGIFGLPVIAQIHTYGPAVPVGGTNVKLNADIWR